MDGACRASGTLFLFWDPARKNGDFTAEAAEGSQRWRRSLGVTFFGEGIMMVRFVIILIGDRGGGIG